MLTNGRTWLSAEVWITNVGVFRHSEYAPCICVDLGLSFWRDLIRVCKIRHCKFISTSRTLVVSSSRMSRSAAIRKADAIEEYVRTRIVWNRPVELYDHAQVCGVILWVSCVSIRQAISGDFYGFPILEL